MFDPSSDIEHPWPCLHCVDVSRDKDARISQDDRTGGVIASADSQPDRRAVSIERRVAAQDDCLFLVLEVRRRVCWVVLACQTKGPFLITPAPSHPLAPALSMQAPYF